MPRSSCLIGRTRDWMSSFLGVAQCGRGIAALAILALCSQPAAAWWDQVHSHITAGAISHLPQPLRGFFEEHSGYLSSQAGLEPPGSHYINIDVYPSFFTGTFPRNYDDLVALHGESYVRSLGTAPWTFARQVDSLSGLMADALDVDDWEALLKAAAVQAHYIEDLHNPFHLTRNYNGQYTGNSGIHARYEGEMILRHFDQVTYSSANAEYLSSPLDFVFDGIDEHYPYVADVLAADDRYKGLPAAAYYTGMWADTGEFTLELLQEASEAVAASWYTAWVDAGSPTTFLPAIEGDFNGDRYVDGSDFLIWQRDPSVGELAAWKANFGNGPTMGAAATVPEPSSLTLLTVSGLLMLARRIRIR